MPILICRLQGDALLHPFARVNAQSVEPRVPQRILIIERLRGLVLHAGDRAVWSTHNVEITAFCAVVPHVQHNTHWQSALNVEIPHLYVSQPIAQVHAVVVLHCSIRAVEGIRQSKHTATLAIRDVRLRYGERWLKGKLSRKGTKLLGVVVDPIASTD